MLGDKWRLDAAAVLFAAILVGTAGLAGAQPAEKVERPDVKVGDTWVYDRFDAFKNTRESSLRSTVTKVDAETIEVELKEADSGQSKGREVYTREWRRALREFGGSRLENEPAYPLFSYPLEAGKAWKQKVRQTRAGAREPFDVEVEAKVTGWEEVSVKAGRFKAIKVEAVGHFNSRTQAGHPTVVRISDNVWYAPAVKRMVKHETREEVISGPAQARGVRRNDVSELIEFAAGP